MALSLMICKGLPEGLMRKMMVLMGLLMVGCASKPSMVENGPSRQSMYGDKPVSAMVFQHPAMGELEAGFYDREKLAPGAFVAFDQPEVTVFQIWTDEHQENQDGWIYRRAMTQRMGVSVR